MKKIKLYATCFDSDVSECHDTEIKIFAACLDDPDVSECIDTAIDMSEAYFLVREYSIAFGSNWLVFCEV